VALKSDQLARAWVAVSELTGEVPPGAAARARAWVRSEHEIGRLDSVSLEPPRPAPRPSRPTLPCGRWSLLILTA